MGPGHLHGSEKSHKPLVMSLLLKDMGSFQGEGRKKVKRGQNWAEKGMEEGSSELGGGTGTVAETASRSYLLSQA